ncbi:MAG: nucleotide sugar dehydrogenase [Deltaproteobacteria bacterium]|nr:MAG: nucleotide sugar dehydrogenase [Deltaproteobacteria bacterium]
MITVGDLKQRIESRNYTVGVIGLGYVGLPLACGFGDAGFRVLGFDVDPAKVEQLNDGRSYIGYIPAEQVAGLVGSGRLRALSDFARLGDADAIIVCVPTPLTDHREPDLRYVERTADDIARTLRPGQLVCLVSTTYPGTTREVLLPRFAARGLQVGSDFFLAYAPEREDPGNTRYTFARIPKVVGGVTPACLELASTLYRQVVEQVVTVSSESVAEATKVLENIYRAVNIALVNELKVVFRRMGIDVWEVIEAARTKPFGFQAFSPGPGLGGHCIPIDPFYLTWKAREFGVTTRFIELAGEVNSAMPAYVVSCLADALNDRQKALKGSKVLVLGVAYKADVDDVRESPALEILSLLGAKGAEATYSDPHVPGLRPMRRHDLGLRSVPLTPESLRRYDAVVLVTDHSAFPYRAIHEEAQLIIDSRHAFHRLGLTGAHVVMA